MRIWTRKKNSLLLLSLLLLGVTIGYAALSTTLKVTGTTNIGKNTWSIYWDNVANQSGVTTTTPVISNDATNGPNTVVTWTVTLDQPGDFYEFTVDAVNAGTLDAMITNIEHKLNGVVMSNNNKLPDYVKYNVSYANGDEIALNQLLPKATVSGNTSTPTRETYKVRIEFDSNIEAEDLSDENISYEISFGVTYGQADGNAVNPHPVIALPQGKNKDNLTVGDEVCINGTTTECFEFVRYDGNDAVLLAKYNLNVNGYTTAKGGTETNLQDSEVRGEWYDSAEDVVKDYGRVYFNKGLDNAYWHDSSYNIEPKYGSSYPLDIYDSDLNGAPNFNENGYVTNDNYTIAYYVERYKSTLEGYGVTIKKARLLTYSEATNTLGCTFDPQEYMGPCPTEGATSFVTRTDFWLGTARNYGYIYRIYFRTLIDELPNSWHGVRPVIVIEKSNLK